MATTAMVVAPFEEATCLASSTNKTVLRRPQRRRGATRATRNTIAFGLTWAALVLCLALASWGTSPASALMTQRRAKKTATTAMMRRRRTASGGHQKTPPEAPSDYDALTNGTGYYPNPKWKQEITQKHPWQRDRFQTQKEAMDACQEDQKCQTFLPTDDNLCQVIACAKQHINCEPRTTLACRLPRTCHEDPTALCPWCYRC